MLALAPRAEALLVAVETFVVDLQRETKALRVVGGTTYSWIEREAMDHFSLFVEIAKRHPSTKGADSGAYMKYGTFRECLLAIGCYRVRI